MSTLTDAIEKESKRKEYREIYNKNPKVKSKRVLYNKKRNGEMSVASKFVANKISKEVAEGMIELLNKEYLEGIANLEGKTNIARTTKHTDNH